MKKYLFVCRHNHKRSRYGEEVFSNFLNNNRLTGEVASAGIGWTAFFFGRKIKKKMLKDITKIFVMEEYMKDYIVDKFGVSPDKIVVLNIPDDYGFTFLKKYSIDDLKKRLERINWKKYI